MLTSRTPETFDALWKYCTADKRVIPRDWNRLYQMLVNKRQKPSGGWEPPLPLILAAWDVTMPMDKQFRFKEHLEWARDQGQLDEIGDYLRSLNESNWYHFGEL